MSIELFNDTLHLIKLYQAARQLILAPTHSNLTILQILI